MANSTYVGVAESHKGVKRVVQSHIFETTVRDIKAYIIVREYDWGDFVLHSISDAQDFIKHVKKEIAKGATLPSMQPGAELQTLFLAAKVRTKSKPPNKIKKKRRNQTKKNQTATKRNRGTPKTKQQKATKKRGVPPQKIYASFCVMEPNVLKNQPPSFWELYKQQTP